MLLHDSSAIDTGMKKGLVGLRRLALCRQAGEPGFEPGLTGSEPVVLPLHHSPEFTFRSNNILISTSYVVLPR